MAVKRLTNLITAGIVLVVGAFVASLFAYLGTQFASATNGSNFVSPATGFLTAIFTAFQNTAVQAIVGVVVLLLVLDLAGIKILSTITGYIREALGGNKRGGRNTGGFEY